MPDEPRPRAWDAPRIPAEFDIWTDISGPWGMIRVRPTGKVTVRVPLLHEYFGAAVAAGMRAVPPEASPGDSVEWTIRDGILVDEQVLRPQAMASGSWSALVRSHRAILSSPSRE